MKIKTRFLIYSITIIGVCILFTNSCKKEDNSKIATLSTTDVSGITQSTATSGGNITDDGKASITARGVCWNTTENPTIANSKTSDGTGNGEFTSSITGLTANTKYYIRSYATNSAGTAYGSQKNFTTALAIVIPTVTTAAITNLTSTSATAGGIVTSAGNGSITESGVYWGTSENPETTGTKVPIGSGIGSFSANLGGVQANTTYFVKAYAKNSAGTGYGSQVTFTTPQIITVPTVTTADVTIITTTTATVGGNVTSSGNGTITDRGVYYGTTTSPETGGTKLQIGSGTGAFSYGLTALLPNTTYYVKAYAINSAGTSFGTQVSFTTQQVISTPSVSTTAVTIFAGTTATLGGEVTFDGNASITDRGVYWGTSHSPETTGSRFQIGSGTGVFSNSKTGLSTGTTYYVKAYATNSKGTAYGSEVSFTTLAPPTVTTTAITTYAGTTATIGGFATADGGVSITDRGVYWGTAQNPETTGTKLQIGSGTGSYTSDLTGLNPNTTYYVKAYATNSVGTSYGSQQSFTTTAAIPTLTTAAYSVLTATTVMSGGNITSDGGSSVTLRGVCWSTAINPTIENTLTNNGSGTGSFVSSVTGLTPNTTYYLRAFASNGVGTGYGNEITFTTNTLTLPVVTTNAISLIRSTSASSGGNVTSDGNATITARGICWSTSTNPTLSNSFTTDGTGIGAFTSSMTGLTLGVTYYVRAYATNSLGTGYGSEVSFKTALAIGDAYQGGIVAYILQSGDPGYVVGETHGLIAAPSDQSTGYFWGANVQTNATATTLGTGNANTNTIVGTAGVVNSAAKLCYDLVLGGYSDWYLPSLGELQKLYENQTAIGGFGYNTNYWTSSEYWYNTAWRQNFTSGYTDYINGYKNLTHAVRAVRSF